MIIYVGQLAVNLELRSDLGDVTLPAFTFERNGAPVGPVGWRGSERSEVRQDSTKARFFFLGRVKPQKIQLKFHQFFLEYTIC